MILANKCHQNLVKILFKYRIRLDILFISIIFLFIRIGRFIQILMTSNMTVDKTIEKKREINDVKNDPDLDKEMLCGVGLFHPSWLQRCGNTMSYSVCYGLTMLVTNALSVYISSQITTLEKQFHLSSSQSGFILSCNDIGFISTVLFMSHFGIRYLPPFCITDLYLDAQIVSWFCFVCRCLTPLSTIFQLYRGGQFFW